MTRAKVKEHDFVGKDAYLRHREEEPAAIMCTLTVDDPTSSSGVKRYMLGREPILTPDGERIVDRKGRPSYVTSAGSGPSVGKHVLMAYLPPEHAVEGGQLLVQYMGERYPVTVAVAGSTPLFDPENTRVQGANLHVAVCIKRVPETGARITLTADEQEIDTSYLGFTISPHEECAVEEALRLVERHGGTTTAVTLGPPAAAEQLRNAVAMGVESALHLETERSDWDPQATAAALADALREGGLRPAPLRQRIGRLGRLPGGIRVAYALGLPCVTGVKGIEIADGTATVRREEGGGWEIFEVPLPAVLTVKEGINLPRYASLPGRLRAKKTEIVRVEPAWREGGLRKQRLVVPQEQGSQVEVLGEGPAAAPRVVEVLRELGVA